MKKTEYQITSQDVHWLGAEAQTTIQDGWTPYAVTPVPNTLDPNQFRLWLRRPAEKKFKKKDSKVIRIQSSGWGGHQVLLHLNDGWIPFSVSMSFDNHIIWFMKEV